VVIVCSTHVRQHGTETFESVATQGSMLLLRLVGRKSLMLLSTQLHFLVLDLMLALKLMALVVVLQHQVQVEFRSRDFYSQH
jgi:hypothetical protein